MLAGGADGMEGYVSVKRDILLEALKGNLVKHEEELKEAKFTFRARAIERLGSMLEQAEGGKEIELSVGFLPPPDNRKSYQRVIRMLEMCTKDEIQISESEFSQYVMDEWSWKGAFAATTSSYNNKNR